MNKFKKLAMTAVSVVMAGAMLVPFAACTPGDSNDPDNPNKPDNPNNPGISDGSYIDKEDTWAGGSVGGGSSDIEYTPVAKPTLPANLTPATDANGKLKYTSGITINTSLGYDSKATGIKYESEQIQQLAKNTSASSVTLAGKTYIAGNLKPAWSALQTELGISIVDNYQGQKASEHIKDLKDTKGTLNNYAFITASADTIVTESVNGTWLNINDYLHYMPNYAAFLQANPVVRLSLTADTETGAMYMLPYFDGNNDIEKYVLMRKDVVEKLLDSTDLSAATGTFAEQATAKNGATTKGKIDVVGNRASVESFMGTTGGYVVSVTDPSALTGTPEYGKNKYEVNDSDAKKTLRLVVDYSAALNAAKDESTALGAALKAAAGKAYTGASGNIVDLQNFAINETNGNVTGAQLTKILQEYIKVTYHLKDKTEPFYTQLSDVFNSAYAAWDVDLYVALGRCAVSSSKLLGSASKGVGVSYMLGSRAGTTNRTYDVASMAGELYGIRGLTSRYQALYAYIDANGEIKDARADSDTWDALAKMNALAKEGLYYTGEAAKADVASIADAKNSNDLQFYSSTDYVQTQTAKGGFAVDGTIENSGSNKVEEGYNYAPVLTPVSYWDTDSDGEKDTIMRFTESWRGVKDGGFCVPKKYVEGNAEKLAAVLAFIDYFYSNDGQILMTYGPQSTNGNTNANGTWFATKASKTLEAAKAEGIVDTYDGEQYFVKSAYKSQYFCYNNELYTGKFYNGKQIPELTTENLNIFYNIAGQNFTNHARRYLGSCLNLGVKDQGFEYQCTSQCGIIGSDIVAIALNNGTIRHTLQTIDENNYWYTLVPTVLPFSNDQISQMKDKFQYISGKGTDGYNFFYANSGCKANLLTDIMYYGYDTSKTIEVVKALNLKIPSNGEGVVSLLNNYGLKTVSVGNNSYMTDAWYNLLDYYDELVAA